MKIIFFIGIFILVSQNLYAFTEEDRIISGYLSVKKSAIILTFVAEKEAYSIGQDETKFHSGVVQDWKVVLKDTSGKVLDSTYLVLKKSKRLMFSNAKSNGKTEEVSEVHAKKMAKIDHLNASKREPFEWAKFTFKDSSSAFKVELYFKGKLKATTRISESLNGG